MIKSILLPLPEGPVRPGVSDFAFWLARAEGSRIHALAVIDIKVFEIPVLGTTDGFIPTMVTPPMQESQALLEEMSTAARERLEQFASECEARKVSCSIETKTGMPGEVITRAGVAHDIVVMARSGYSGGRGADGKLDPIVSQVLRDSIRPVLVVGKNFGEPGAGKRLLVAYDGSVHAGRALLIAGELGARPGIQTKLITIATSEEIGKEIMAPADAYLRNHGVTVERQVIIGGKASEMICELVGSAGTDVLIMGAYGHSPMREMLFGSTTEKVLSHCGATVILQS